MQGAARHTWELGALLSQGAADSWVAVRLGSGSVALATGLCKRQVQRPDTRGLGCLRRLAASETTMDSPAQDMIQLP